MTEVPVKNLRGEVVGSVELDERVFGIEPNRAVLHQAVVAQLANKRQGTHDTKTRAEVAGGTHKVYRQKGTGRARQGDRRAPHWSGGGIVFGPHPRSYRQALPRKMRRLAMRSALSARLAEEALTVVDELTIPAPKTREMRGVLEALGLASGALIVVPERDETVARASANLEGVRAVTPGGLNLLDVLNFRHVLLTRSAAHDRAGPEWGRAARPTRPARRRHRLRGGHRRADRRDGRGGPGIVRAGGRGAGGRRRRDCPAGAGSRGRRPRRGARDAGPAAR
jgi:large subunit ribosomal protein L4